MEKYKQQFTLTNEMFFIVSNIMEKIGMINSFDNLSKYPLLRKQNRIKSIHSSCAIENNTLSLDETTNVINGTIVKGPKKDIIEILNAFKAYETINKINPFSETDLKKTHAILGQDVVDCLGKYRTGNEGVFDENGNAIFIAPPPAMVPSLMKQLFTWLRECKNQANILIESCVFHYEFVFIHPFSDGNGRLARLWQNAILGLWKPIFYYLPVETHIKKHQIEYYSAISKSHINGNSNEFIIFMLNMINDALEELVNDVNLSATNNSIYLTKLSNVLKGKKWYTANEILVLLNLKSKETLRKNYINPALMNGIIELEYPEKITSKNQRYRKII